MLLYVASLLLPLALAASPTPEQQARLDAAENAWRQKDEAAAEKLLAQLTEEVPDWERPWRRRCGVVLAQGRTSEAVELCRKALALDPSVENRTALALALIRDTLGVEIAGEPELEEARALIEAATTARADYAQAWAAMCELAIVKEDPAILQRCVEELEKHHPDDAGTLYYRVHLDLERADFNHARRALVSARSKGLSDDLYQPLVLRVSAAFPEDQAEPAGVDALGSPTAMLPWVIAAGLALSVAAIALLGDRSRPAPAAPPEGERAPDTEAAPEGAALEEATPKDEPRS